MRLVLLPFLFLLSSISLAAQPLPEWYRVYSFDESIIDMNTSIVTLISPDVSRVRFRWIFDELQELSGEPGVKYKSRLEVWEFNCSEKRYRPHHFTFFDAAANTVRLEHMNPPGEWRTVRFANMMQKLFEPACELIKKKTRPPVISSDTIELEKAAKFALLFARDLEKAKDFKPIIEKFFVANYLDGYLHEKNSNWFLNLNRDTAARVSRSELHRFYVALLNTGYLSSAYVISRLPSDSDEPTDSDEPISDERVIPPDVVQLIRNHPYTAAYKGEEGNYDYLAENIDSVERLRSYTDLLESVGASMRQHVVRVGVEHSREYQAILDWDWGFELYQPRVQICARNCFGLPNGTRLFEVNVPVFRLQLAEIKGDLKIVSAISNF